MCLKTMRVSEPLKRDLLRGVGVPTCGIRVPTLIYGNGPFPCPGFPVQVLFHGVVFPFHHALVHRKNSQLHQQQSFKAVMVLSEANFSHFEILNRYG